jgi:hypothetical protein
MTANRWISEIRSSPKLSRLYDDLTIEERRKAYEESDGEGWHLQEILENIREDRNGE